MKHPVLISIGFHIAVVTALTVSWPDFRDDTPQEQLVIIDMVDVADITNIVSSSEGTPQDDINQERTRPKPPPPPPPPPPAPAPAPEPAPVQPEPKPEPAPAPKPVDVAAEIIPDETKEAVKRLPAAPKPRPKPPEKPKPKPKAPEKPKPKPAEKPKPKPAEKPKPKPDLSRINKLAQQSAQQKQEKADAATGVLQNLAKLQKAKEAEKRQAEKVKKEETKAKVASNLSNVISKVEAPKTDNADNARLTVSEFDKLKGHIASFWNPPAGSAGASKLKVDVSVKLNSDGSVIEASVVDVARYNKDRIYRSAANAAMRAVLDASPLPLPEKKYELWKEFIFGFDPRFISR